MSKTMKKLIVSLLSVLMILSYMPAVAFAAATTCHIGEVHYATLAEALSDAEFGDTIVIDSADAGAATITHQEIKIDVGTSGYDIKNVTYDEDYICAVTNGTVTSYAWHNYPAEEGGIIFNWDTSVVPATATVTFKDANGHTRPDVAAEVTSVPADLSALCEEDKEVTYTASYYYLSEKKTMVVKKVGHKYALKEQEQSVYWDGKKYDSNGVPIVKNVKVYCVNEGDAAQLKDATVEFVEAVPDKDNAPTCTTTGKVDYFFKVLYDGETIKDVTAAKEEDRAKDKLLKITDSSAPATGIHEADVTSTEYPKIEYKAYKTTTVDGETVFVSAIDSEKTVTDKKDAAIEWKSDATQSAYAQGYDDVLTYHIAWICKNPDKEVFYDDPVELKPTVTTAYYLANGDVQKTIKNGQEENITAANKCTAYSIDTGNFAAVKVIYDKKESGAQKVKNFVIPAVARPRNTNYDPQHNPDGVEVVVVDPTHTTVGTKKFTCGDCLQDVTVELPKVGEHKFVENSLTTVDPTCTKAGYTYQVCELCAAADLAPVGTDGKAVEGLPADFTTKGAIVSATTPALGHNYVVLNGNNDATWADAFTKDKGNVSVSVLVNYVCTRCSDTSLGITHTTDKAPATPADKTVYESISYTTAKAKDCTEHDVITFTVDGLKDLHAGKDLSKSYTDESVIGPHAYTVKTANFSADGKSVNATITCGNGTTAKPCLGDKERVISATSTASAVDAETGITTYTASITDANLHNADIDKAEIDTTIPADAATKKLYVLSGAEVTVPNYTDAEYAAKKASDVVVKIGNATIDPKYYTINWPEVTAPNLKAKLTVTATDYEKDGVAATGTSKPVTFEVTKTLTALPEGEEVKVEVNGKDPKGEDEFEFDYNGEENTLVATSKVKDAVVSYLINGKAADEVALKDVCYDEDGDMYYYSVQYVIRYKDGSIYTSDPYEFMIWPAYVKLIKTDYEKIVGTDDPAIEYDEDVVVEGDDLQLAFEKHSEQLGTYKLNVECNNPNYGIYYPENEDQFVTLVIRKVNSDEEAATDAANAAALADKEAADAAKTAEEKAAAADAAIAAATTDEEKAAAADLAADAAAAAKTAAEKAEAAKAANDASVAAATKAYGADSAEAKNAQTKADAAAKVAEKQAAAAKAAAEKAEAAKGQVKAENTMTVKAKTVKAKANKKTTFKKAKAFTVKDAQGKVTFKKAKGNKKVTVKKNGKVIVKKGLKKGKTFKIKVKVTAAGNENYKSLTQTVTLKVKVK